LKQILFLFLIIFAIVAINTPRIRRIAIYICMFSFSSSLLYVLFSAPDVSIAEAIIGSTLATILYLVAFQKYRFFTIYYTNEDFKAIDDEYIAIGRQRIITTIENFCVFRHLEPQVIYSVKSLDEISHETDYDLIIREKDDMINIYGKRYHYQLDTLRQYLDERKEGIADYTIRTIKEDE